MPGAHDMADIYRTTVAADMIVKVSDRTRKQEYNESHILNMQITMQNMWAHNCNLNKTLCIHSLNDARYRYCMAAMTAGLMVARRETTTDIAALLVHTCG